MDQFTTVVSFISAGCSKVVAFRQIIEYSNDKLVNKKNNNNRIEKLMESRKQVQ